jgi:hypothetical protein
VVAAGDSVTQITSFSPPASEPLKLPDGRPVDSVDMGPLYGEFGRLGVPGFRHQLGRTDAVALYARHLQSIHDEAGRAAVAAWLAANK